MHISKVVFILTSQWFIVSGKRYKDQSQGSSKFTLKRAIFEDLTVGLLLARFSLRS